MPGEMLAAGIDLHIEDQSSHKPLHPAPSRGVWLAARARGRVVSRRMHMDEAGCNQCLAHPETSILKIHVVLK